MRVKGDLNYLHPWGGDYSFKDIEYSVTSDIVDDTTTSEQGQIEHKISTSHSDSTFATSEKRTTRALYKGQKSGPYLNCVLYSEGYFSHHSIYFPSNLGAAPCPSSF